MEKANRNYFSATRVAVIAMFSTIAGVLYAFGFPIAAAFPSWLELNFSDIPALIGTFALGPVSGVIIVFVKILVKLIIKGTTTTFVGELADLLIGVAFVVPAGLIYKKRRTFKGALVAMAVGTACSTAMSILANWAVLVPFYRQLFFRGSWEPLLSPMRALFGEGCTERTFYTFYIWCSVLPFNLLRCAIAVAVTLPVYKHVSRLINRVSAKLEPKKTATASSSGESAVVERNIESAERGSVALDGSGQSGGAAGESGEKAQESKGAGRRAVNKRTVITAIIVAAAILLLVGGVLLRYFLTKK